RPFHLRYAPVIHDELDATDFLAALRRAPHELRTGERVADPLLPFDPPPSYVPDGRRKATVVLGEQLLAQLRLRRGDVLTVMTVVPDPTDPEGRPAINNRDFVVGGSFRTGENDIDLTRIYLDRRELADFLGSGASFSEILVTVRDYDAEGLALQQHLVGELDRRGLVYSQGPDDPRPWSQVVTWEDVRRPLLGAIENERVLMAIMLSLTLVVAGFTIYAILTMMVIEKRRDIGILSALGATPRGVLATFLMIGFWDALIGAAAGALFGVQAALHIDGIERSLSAAFGFQIFDRTVYYFDEIPSRVDALPVVLIVAGAFVATLLSAAMPAWRAARQHPIDALRYE
ncbi:MAG TPA: FtsX-like permease family protein, partial [Planctomycetota bacterium]|nr:FtsX-like permease family protein [Planctomycetota bacterium]